MTKPAIVYVYDGLCPWCYGSIPQMRHFAEKNKHRFDFKVVSGGMFRANQYLVQDAFGEKLYAIHQQVIETTGAHISSAYLDDLAGQQNYAVNSEITAAAFSTFKIMTDADVLAQLDFILAMQTGLFSQGLNPNKIKLYKQAAKAMDLDSDKFIKTMGIERVMQDVSNDFELSRVLKVARLPEVFYRHDDKYVRISRGFTTSEALEQAVTHAQKMLDDAAH